MAWIAAGAAIGSSLLSGSMGSSSAKDQANDIKDAAREANDMQMLVRNEAKYDFKPFLDSGTNANALLSEYLGIASPKGYAPKPTRDQVANEFADRHYKYYGRNYSAKDSNMGSENNLIDAEYQRRLDAWEDGLEQYKKDNPEDGAGGENFGRLLRDFTADDFEKDPGHNFELQQGELGIDRALAARGGRESGAALKAIARYHNDFAGTKFNQAFQRDAQNKNNIYGFLSGTAGAGQQAAGAKAGLNLSSVSQANQNSLNAANAASAYNMQGSNILNQGIQSAVGNGIYAYNRAQNSSVFGGNSSSSNNNSPGVGTTEFWRGS